jgi:hypothetical protein
VIGPTGAVRVLVATKPVDFRKGADGLAALVRETMGADPFSGAVYVFRAKRADRIKLVFWDGTGVVLVAKRHVPKHHDRTAVQCSRCSIDGGPAAGDPCRVAPGPVAFERVTRRNYEIISFLGAHATTNFVDG